MSFVVGVAKEVLSLQILGHYGKEMPFKAIRNNTISLYQMVFMVTWKEGVEINYEKKIQKFPKLNRFICN